MTFSSMIDVEKTLMSTETQHLYLCTNHDYSQRQDLGSFLQLGSPDRSSSAYEAGNFLVKSSP